MDFDKEIPKAVRELANSMNKPIKDLCNYTIIKLYAKKTICTNIVI